MRELRAIGLLAFAFLGIASAGNGQALTVLDVPFIAQSELLCGGAAAAMVMRYWGERGVDADTFSPLVERNAGGIRTAALAADLRARRWNAIETAGTDEALGHEIQQQRPVIVLLEERPGTFHYVVVVARTADGVVYHDPARNPFRVTAYADFDRRWADAGRWMLVVTPTASEAPAISIPAVANTPESGPLLEQTFCDQLVAQGVREANDKNLGGAERALVAALSCPGAAPFRELAGLRVLQRRWPEASDLADIAVRRDPSDAYAWKLLATARFVDDEPGAALDAWNRAGEPRIDLIRVDGLSHTRNAVVQRLIGLKSERLLTSANLAHARRRLGELPAATGAALDFEPVPSGLVEVRARIAERSLSPTGIFELGALSLATGVTKELVTGVSSPSGGGERISIDWRFWQHRPLYQVSYAAPALASSIWTFTASREIQPYSVFFARTVHESVRVDVADWMTRSIRWQLGAGTDRWNDERSLALATAGARFVTPGDRIDARFLTRSWFGNGSPFHSAQALLTARTSSRQVGFVVMGGGGVSTVSASAPADLWYAGDTGRARPLMLRAHPVLGEGERFQTERLGRLVGNGSLEVQRWWRAGPGRVAAAMFVDAAKTARRAAGPAIEDVDVGIGFRGGYPGRAGAIGVNLARGLRDGNTALSMVYTP